MKKNLFCALLICTALLTACSKPDETITVDLITPDSPEPHIHAPTGGWICDFDSHWRLCECGEEMDKGEHTLEQVNCTVCGSQVVLWEDGSYKVDTPDENSRPLRAIYYDAVEHTEIDRRYIYSEDGSRMTEETYLDGALAHEQDCRWNNEAGCWEMTAEKAYGDDGILAYTYDDSGNPLSVIHYNPDGSVKVEYTYENTYDLSGNCIFKRTFTNGILTQEIEFLHSIESDGSVWSRSGKTTDYYEDGSYTVHDGDEGTWSSEITYAADGSVITELFHEYLKDENGNSIGRKSYTNGHLTTEYTEILDKTGKSIGLITIDYHEDGTKTVCEFDKHQALVSETNYAADGSIVSG